MSQQIEAIYVGGVLQPLVPLALPDKSRVKITVDATSVPEQAETKQSAIETEVAPTDFDRQLELLLFDGPSLPPDFSRADIYADHE
jgi:predicted DNA-binding antitoxin AbrB/MazE fold protein